MSELFGVRLMRESIEASRTPVYHQENNVTTYLIFTELEAAYAADEDNGQAWRLIGEADAPNPTTAIKQAADGTGSFWATPKSSWHGVELEVETVQRVTPIGEITMSTTKAQPIDAKADPPNQDPH